MTSRLGLRLYAYLIPDESTRACSVVLLGDGVVCLSDEREKESEMMQKSVGKICSVMMAVALLFLAAGLAGADSASYAEIPVTTTSQEARQLYLQGQDLLDNLQVTDSRPYFEKALAVDPKFALAHLRLAFTATNPGAFLASVSDAKALVGQVSEGERLWILAADAGAQGRATEANELFQRLAAAYPKDARAHFLLGGSYFGLQKWEEAVAAYRRALAINPKLAATYNQMGYALRFLGDYPEAEKAFQKYIELIPDQPNPYDSYAELLLTLGRYEESIQSYRKALAVDPQFVPSYLGLATDFNLQNKHEQARAELKKMLAQARTDGERRQAHFATAVSYADEGRLDDAVKAMWKLHAIAEKNENTIQIAQDLNAIALLQLEAGKTKQAEQNYRKAVEMREKADIPASAKEQARRDLHSNLARVFLSKGDLEAAGAEAAKFGEMAETSGNPNQVRLYHELSGAIALAAKDYDKAIKDLKQANQQNPYNLYRLAQAYRGRGDKEDARRLFQQLEALNQLNSLNYSLVRKKASRLLASL